tara:strand:- start:759 stop:1610 length:852 start_codon:yes stop_codon:yes gene_type:complete
MKIETRNNLESCIKSEIQQLSTERETGWENYRSTKRFEKDNITINIDNNPHIRSVWAPISKLKAADHTANLQKSRGSLQESLLEYTESWDQKMQISKIERSRIDELEHVIEIITDDSAHENAFKAPGWKPKGYCDIGFKYPRLLKHYGQKYNIPTLGIDINDLSVNLARYNGYSACVVDLVNDEQYGMQDINLVTINHVLEHVTYPPQIIGKLYNEVQDGTIIQAEVPIEFNSPKLDFGHMFGFHPGDLIKFFTSFGFLGLCMSTTNIGHAYVTERVTVMKVA